MLLAPTDTSLRLRDFSDAHIVHLARYGQTRMERELQEGQVEVEAELQARPYWSEEYGRADAV